MCIHLIVGKVKIREFYCLTGTSQFPIPVQVMSLPTVYVIYRIIVISLSKQHLFITKVLMT